MPPAGTRGCPSPVYIAEFVMDEFSTNGNELSLDASTDCATIPGGTSVVPTLTTVRSADEQLLDDTVVSLSSGQVKRRVPLGRHHAHQKLLVNGSPASCRNKTDVIN